MPRPPALIYGEPDRTSADPGLFGPSSITWRIHADPVAALGGLRALLLQALEPESMAAVHRYSDYRSDPWGRLFRTAEFIGITTFGTTEEAQRAGARVQAVHAALSVNQPDLLAYIHIGFVDSMLEAFQRGGPGLSKDEANAYVKEQVRAAALVGLSEDEVPSSVAELKAALDAWRPRLSATPVARDAARFIMVPPMQASIRYGTPAQGIWAGMAATAFGLLPRWARQMYGGSVAGPALAGLPIVAEWQATLAARAIRSGLLAVPDRLAKGPHARAAEQRLGI